MRYVVLYCLVVISLPWGMGRAAGPVKVGVYYYPWYKPDAGGHGFKETLRQHLKPSQQPKIGLYSNTDPNVIEAHIRQSVRGNIQFWACSWWGPGSFEDNVLKNVILTHPSASKLKYAILYESTGRLGAADNPDYSNLLKDFVYFKEKYFNHPFYLKINNRPVVFIYLTRVYFRNRGEQALAALRKAFPEVYLVGDDIFGPNYRATDAARWDAVTAYDVYGQTLAPKGSTRQAIHWLKKILQDAGASARQADVGLIPFACPGFNDRGVRSGHAAAPRYFVDAPDSAEGDIFRAMLRDAVVPAVDPRADNILMVTSFNEWHEDTQIEPTAGNGTTTTRDDSDNGTQFTQDFRYVDYGDLYLKILRQETAAVAESNKVPNR